MVWHGQVEGVRPFMKKWALLVHPPLAPEPFGRVLVEAMAEGCPPVAARAGAVPEVVEEGVTGWLFSPGSEQDLADVLRAALLDPAERERRGQAGRELVRRRFDRRRCVGEVERVYRDLLSLV